MSTRPALSPEEWARVQEAFLDALDRPAADRAAFLDGVLAGDARLRAEVASLLAAHDRGGPIAEPPAAEPTTPVMSPWPLRWVGPYRLLAELGRGGMGSVYLAEREGEGFTQRVALKLMRPDYADTRVAAQLEAERRILARLEHPGIARFIDGGTTPSQQPYIAMEYVDGTPLLDYCVQQGLDVRRRVELFAEVCDAAQYAHGQLVVHRDLKPSNVMVTRHGAPKLLDFGVATVLSDVPRDPARQTGNWMTPAYASPEQFRREPVTVVTDIYALGTILYQLLTGRHPHDLGDGSWETILHAVTMVTPERPSVWLRQSGESLSKTLAADLDAIVLKALAKEPGRRYASAEQMGEDLRRWLRGDPVRAQPDSLGYRAGKFVRRHRTLVLLGAVTVASLAGGLAAVAWQARIARQERDVAETARQRSEDVTGFLLGLFEASSPLGGADSLTSRILLQAGMQRVDELAEQPLVQAAMLDALGRIQVTMGHPAEALRLHERGATLREATLGRDHPDLAVSHRQVATALRHLGRYAEAEARLRQGYALEIQAYGEGSLETTETLLELGFLLPYLGRLAEAESVYRRANAIQVRELGANNIRTLRSELVVALRTKDRDRAEGERMLRDLIRRAPQTTDEWRLLVARVKLHLGDLLAGQAESAAEAEELFRDALRTQEAVLGQQNLALSHGLGALASVLEAQRRFAEAESLIIRRVELHRVLLGDEHTSTITARTPLASIRVEQGRLAEAEAIRAEALAGVRRVAGNEHTFAASLLISLADVVSRRGDQARAEALAREAVELRSRLNGPTHHLVYAYRSSLAVILARRGQFATAEAEATEVIAGLRGLLAPDDPLVRAAETDLAEIRRLAGRFAASTAPGPRTNPR